MKRSILILTIITLGLSAFIFTGCRKYPDGPALSLKSKSARLTNTWKVESYLKNGNDMTPNFAGYTETFTEHGDYFYTLESASGSGKWNFQNDNREIRINGIQNQPSQTLYVLRLESNSLWYYYFDGNDRKEFHMVPF